MFQYGSQLTKRLFPNFREPKDIDFVTNDINEYNSNISKIPKGTELHYIPCTPNREMTADELYTLKFSHAIYDIHWQKTMSDIRFFQLRGCKIIPQFLSELRIHWETKHINKRCNFEKGEKDFFKDNVSRQVPHDDLHKIFNQTPSYTHVVEGVKPIKEKFDIQPINIKDGICWEEAWVISIERYYGKLPYRTAYNRAQQDLITRLHPIWIADYIIENWSKTFWTAKNNYYDIYETRIN
jgi:hypothetical protein